MGAPRYLWRRLAAFLIDLALAGFLTMLLMWPLMHGATDKLRMGNPILTVSRCGSGTGMTPEMAAYLGRDRVLAITYCQRWAGWIPNGQTADVLLERERVGKWTRSLTATVPIDQKGRPVQPVAPDGLIALFLLIVGSAWLLTRTGGQTIGKALLGLEVELPDNAAALRREMFRVLPAVVLVLADGALQASPTLARGVQAAFAQLISTGPVPIILVALALSALSFWYYVLPFFRGDRRARWDRWAGSRVVRV